MSFRQLWCLVTLASAAPALAQAERRSDIGEICAGLGGKAVETVVDGDNTWEKNPDSATHTMSKTDLAIAQRDHQFHREVKLKELFPEMETAAADKVNGRAAYVIEVTPANGPTEKLYFDVESGLLVKRVTLEDGIVRYEVLLG